jgi:hypothetical protein
LYGPAFSSGPLTPDELKMRSILLDMLVSYAKTRYHFQYHAASFLISKIFSIPTIEGVKWNPTAYDKLTYLNISGFRREEIKLETVDELTPRGFWNSLKFAENENLISLKDEL